jgi:DNA repair protein RadA/Sms
MMKFAEGARVAARKKGEIVYRCSSCGQEEGKWLGRCPACGAWNTLEEERRAEPAAERDPGAAFSLPIAKVDPGDSRRYGTGLPELDRAIGGGLMRSAAYLVGGEPGIGKSTLLLKAAAGSGLPGPALYVSGEESAAQVRLRAERVGALSPSLELFCGSTLEDVLSVLAKLKPSLAVIDSIQTMRSLDLPSAPGSPNQMRACAEALTDWAKSRGAALFLVAHMTKDGLIAGPRTIEHLVDAVLHFEQGDGDLRVLRASKNRFGPVDEIAIFTMGPEGLKEVADPSRLFLPVRKGALPAGVAAVPVWEGSRALVVEIQALVVPAKAGLSRVYSDKIDSARVARIAAVVERHAGMRLSDHDIYVNVAGGLRLAETGIDLGLALALQSARSGLALPQGLAFSGELSLAGEIRPVPRLRQRFKAAQALGFGRLVGPDPAFDEGGELPGWERAGRLADAAALAFAAPSA